MTTTHPPTLYHNPHCSKSREALNLLRAKGLTVDVVEYLKNPPSKETLQNLARLMGGVRPMLRTKADVYEEMNLGDAKWSEAQLLDFLLEHPALLERPLLVTDKGARIGRPTELLLEIL